MNNYKETLNKLIDVKKKNKVDKIVNNLDSYNISDLRDLCQLNIIKEKVKK